jgi:hypothetical protein
MSNNVFLENVANDTYSRGGAILCTGRDADVLVINTILWGNEAVKGPEIFIGGTIPPVPSALEIRYSDVKGGENSVHVREGSKIIWGPGMIDEDPLFVSFHGFDYLLGRGSPCIDAGDPNLDDGFEWPVGYMNGPRSDMGAYGGPGNVGWLQ